MREDIQEVLRELKQRLEIDEYALEKECRDQALLYAEIGELYVDAKREARAAKETVDFDKAELDSKIRSNPEEYDVAKITEGAISSTILRNEEYRKTQASFLSSQEIVDAFQILLSAAEQRKAMLRDLVSLYIYNYYSDTGPGKSTKELSKLAEEKYMREKELKKERKREDAEERSSGRD